MSDVMWLRGISAHANHGVFEFEREQGQRFVLDVGYEFDTRAAARTDDVDDTISYADVARALHDVLTREPANLIETVAERMAAAVLAFGGIRAATVVLHKPEAPLAVPFADVALTIRRTPLTVVPIHETEVALGLGGNVGDTAGFLRDALDRLAAEVGALEVGPLVRTRAMTLPGSAVQADYWNTVAVARTRLSAHEVLEAAHRAEERAGRQRNERWGPRTLDVDVLTYGDVLSEDPELTLPHPGAATRPFVVVPWASLRPGAILGGRTLAARARELEGEILQSEADWR